MTLVFWPLMTFTVVNTPSINRYIAHIISHSTVHQGLTNACQFSMSPTLLSRKGKSWTGVGKRWFASSDGTSFCVRQGSSVRESIGGQGGETTKTSRDNPAHPLVIYTDVWPPCLLPWHNGSVGSLVTHPWTYLAMTHLLGLSKCSKRLLEVMQPFISNFMSWCLAILLLKNIAISGKWE